MKIKIALSASFYNVKAVHSLLLTCERIYTTNTRCMAEICALFGDRVRGIPDGTTTTYQWIKEREQENLQPGDVLEFIDYGHLLEISNVTDQRVSILTEELKTQLLLVEALRKEVLDLQEDQRRLDCLSARRLPGLAGEPANTWSVTGQKGQSLRDVLDCMRVAYVQPVAQAPYNRVPSPSMTLSHELAAAVNVPNRFDDRIGGSCETRDPLDQDHSAIPAGAIAQDYRGESQ